MKIVDLRSDTLTLPDDAMLKTILQCKLGDDGRQNHLGRGEDGATNELEDYAAKLTGKEEGLFFSSGTIANSAAIMTHCTKGDKILIDPLQHIYRTEKFVFDKNYGGLNAVFYSFTQNNEPDVHAIEEILSNENVKLICVENTHNFTGGTCTSLETMKQIYTIAKSKGIHVHLDGARLFNAAQALNTSVSEICQHTDSVMFCVSKGLGAPIGSLLCSSGDFIRNARQTRKLFGANMRQCGIMAAPALYALMYNVERLKEDAENAKFVADNLKDLKNAEVQKDVQSNIVMIHTQKSGLSAAQYCDRLQEMGLLIRPIIEDCVRLVFYKGITKEDAILAVNIIKELDNKLS